MDLDCSGRNEIATLKSDGKTDLGLTRVMYTRCLSACIYLVQTGREWISLRCLWTQPKTPLPNLC
jgi:hypothetical protein